MTDYYRVLDLPKSATQEDIRCSYRKKTRLYHPDKNSQNKEWAEMKFKEVQTAYETLSVESRRRAYDKHGDDYRYVPTNAASSTVFHTDFVYFQGPHNFCDVSFSKETGQWCIRIVQTNRGKA
jgi:DnaJ-class molecular chaperone